MCFSKATVSIKCHWWIDILIRLRQRWLRWAGGGFWHAQSRLTWLTWLLKPQLFLVGLTGPTLKVPRLLSSSRFPLTAAADTLVSHHGMNVYFYFINLNQIAIYSQHDHRNYDPKQGSFPQQEDDIATIAKIWRLNIVLLTQIHVSV